MPSLGVTKDRINNRHAGVLIGKKKEEERKQHGNQPKGGKGEIAFC